MRSMLTSPALPKSEDLCEKFLQRIYCPVPRDPRSLKAALVSLAFPLRIATVASPGQIGLSHSLGNLLTDALSAHGKAELEMPRVGNVRISRSGLACIWDGGRCEEEKGAKGSWR